MAAPTTPRYQLRSRDKPRDVSITPKQILNTFYGAFFEPLIRAKTKEFSFDFLNEQNFSSKFPKHWKTLLRNESTKTPVQTFTISIEQLNFVTVKYFAATYTERFLILEPSFLEKLKNDYETIQPTTALQSIKKDKIMVSIPLNEFSNNKVQKLKIQFIENCEKTFFSKYISAELKKPTLLLGHIFSLPEFKRALIDLDYVTNAVENLKESKFVRKISDDESSSSEETRSEHISLPCRNYLDTNTGGAGTSSAHAQKEKLLESFQSLRPAESRKLKRKLAKTKPKNETFTSKHLSDHVSSIVKTVISNNTQPLQLIFNMNQNGTSQAVQIGQRTTCRSPERALLVTNGGVTPVYIPNSPQIQDLDTLIPEKPDIEKIIPTRSEYHLVTVKFEKIKIGIQITLKRHEPNSEFAKFLKKGNLENTKESVQRNSSIRKTFLDYTKDMGWKAFDLQYLASISTKNFQLFKEKKQTISRCDLEDGKISMVQQRTELNMKIAESICIKIPNKDTGKSLELFEIAPEDSELELISLQQEQQKGNNSGFSDSSGQSDVYNKPETPKPPSKLLNEKPHISIRPHCEPQLKSPSTTQDILNEVEEARREEPNSQRISSQCTSRPDNSGDETSADIVAETDNTCSRVRTIITPVQCSSKNIQQQQIQEAPIKEATIQETNFQIQKQIRQEVLPLKKAYILLRRITNKARERHYKTSLRLNTIKSLKFSKKLDLLYYFDKNKKINKARRNLSVNASRPQPMKQGIVRRIFSASCHRNNDSFLKLTRKKSKRNLQHLKQRKQNLKMFCKNREKCSRKVDGKTSQSTSNQMKNCNGLKNQNSSQNLPHSKKAYAAPILPEQNQSRCSKRSDIAQKSSTSKIAVSNIARQPVLRQPVLSSYSEWKSSNCSQKSSNPDTCTTSSRDEFRTEPQLSRQNRQHQAFSGSMSNSRASSQSLINLEDLNRQSLRSTGVTNKTQMPSTVQNFNRIEDITNGGSMVQNMPANNPPLPPSTHPNPQQARSAQFAERPINSNYFSELRRTLKETAKPLVRQTLSNVQRIRDCTSRSLSDRSNSFRPTSIVAPAVGTTNRSAESLNIQNNPNQPIYSRAELSNNIAMSGEQYSEFHHTIPSTSSQSPQYLRKRPAPVPASVPICSPNYHAKRSYLSNLPPGDQQRLTTEQNIYGGTYVAPPTENNQIHMRPRHSNHVQDNNPFRISPDDPRLRQQSNSSPMFSQRRVQSIYSSSNLEATVSTQCSKDRLPQRPVYEHNSFQQHSPNLNIPVRQSVFADERQCPLSQIPHQYVANNSILPYQQQPPSVQQSINHNPPRFSELAYKNMLIQRYNQVLGQLQVLATNTQRTRDILVQSNNNQAVVFVLQQAGQNTIIQPIHLGVIPDQANFNQS